MRPAGRAARDQRFVHTQPQLAPRTCLREAMHHSAAQAPCARSAQCKHTSARRPRQRRYGAAGVKRHGAHALPALDAVREAPHADAATRCHGESWRRDTGCPRHSSAWLVSRDSVERSLRARNEQAPNQSVRRILPVRDGRACSSQWRERSAASAGAYSRTVPSAPAAASSAPCSAGANATCVAGATFPSTATSIHADCAPGRSDQSFTPSSAHEASKRPKRALASATLRTGAPCACKRSGCVRRVSCPLSRAEHEPARKRCSARRTRPLCRHAAKGRRTLSQARLRPQRCAQCVQPRAVVCERSESRTRRVQCRQTSDTSHGCSTLLSCERPQSTAKQQRLALTATAIRRKGASTHGERQRD